MAIALAFLVVLKLLFSIDKKIDGRIAYREYPTMAEAVGDIIHLAEKRRLGGHSIQVLASTAATTVNAVLPRLEHLAQTSDMSVNVHIKLINPRSALARLMPDHWAEETIISLRRLKEFRHLAITISQYPYLPCLGGVLIDDNHLFLGFYVWEQNEQGNFLQGAEQPHFYFRRGLRTEYPFRLWESWFDLAPSDPVPTTPIIVPERARFAEAPSPAGHAHVVNAIGPQKKLIIAHRGAVSLGAHENSIAAFESAIQLGADMIECDIRRTHDGKFVSHHDSSIGGLEISRTVFSELSNAAAKSGFELATVEDIARCTNGRIGLDVELKEPGYEPECLNLLKASFDQGLLRITSFHASSIRRIKSLEPTILAGLIVENADEHQLSSLYSDASADFLAPHYCVLEQAAQLSHELFVWGADDDHRLLASLRHPKVVGIITNLPRIACILREATNTPESASTTPKS